MTLTAKDVAEITRLLEDSSFDELYLEIDGVKLSLRRGGTGAAAPASSSPAIPSLTADPVAPAPARRSAPPTAGRSAPAPRRRAEAAPAVPPPAHAPDSVTDSSLHDVPAPLLGTFYRAPKPGAPAFVEIGSPVDEETIIGIIEVMKLMNTVRAGVGGRVVEILARDGALVEYGETLMRVGKLS